MSKNKPIYVPVDTINELYEEDKRKREEELKRLRKKYIESLTEELNIRAGGIIIDGEARDKIKLVCSKLLNKRNGILHHEPLTLPEIGRVLSDVLLGRGIQYEILT